ncbi:MAG: ATP-binding protein, partial [Acidobacteriota bacterium]
VELPWPCSNEVYEARLGGLWDAAQREGVEVIAYGDLFLEDIRAYRERQLAGTGLEPRFPLWGRDTGELAVEMIDGGLEAIVVTVDRQCLAPDFVGRAFDRDFLRDLPADVDPCGENGEFHTFVYDSPQFDQPLATSVGDHRRDDRFAWVDLSVDRLD